MAAGGDAVEDTDTASVRTVGSDAELHSAINDGEREIRVVPGEGFELLRTFGLARDGAPMEWSQRIDLVQVEPTGAEPYLAANAVVAGMWESGRRVVARRRPLVTRMGERTLEVRATSLAVCNGQFVAPARWLAPRAHPADGRLAVLIDGNRGHRARALMKRMPLGDHVPDRLIHQLRPLELEVDGAAWPLQADGIAGRGRLPARFTVQPGSLLLSI